MKLSEIYKMADTLAPKRLSDEYCERYGAYDNSGILVDCGEEITGVVCSLDLSLAAIEEAIKRKANLIITHHPAIYGKIGSVCVEEPLGAKIVKCIRNGISVIAMHLNLDCVEGGVDESLMQGVVCAAGGAEAKAKRIMHPLSEGGYGRVYGIPTCSLENLKKSIEKEFFTSRILYYGEGKREIKNVASFCGAGVDEGAIAFATDENADLILSSDFKHHQIALAIECGLAVMILPHYVSENYGFKKYYEKIRRQISVPCVYHTDEILL